MYKMMRVFVLLLLYLSTLEISGAAETPTMIWEKCERARSLSQYDSLGIYSQQLQKASSGNQRLTAFSLFYKGLSHLFTGKAQEAMPLFGQSQQIAERIDNDSIMALVMNAKGIYHIMVENNNFLALQMFFRSLEYAERAGYEQMKSRIHGNLLILTQSENDTTGIRNAQVIYRQGKHSNDYEQTFMGAYYLAMYHNLRGENDKAEEYIKESLAIYEKCKYDDVASVYTLYSKVELDKGNTALSEHYALEAIRLAKQYKQSFLLPDAYLQYATMLNATKQYAKSNEMAMMALQNTEDAGKNKTISCYRLISRNCRSLGLTDMALDYLEKAANATDTLMSINMDRLNHERSVMLSIQKKEREEIVRKQQMASQRVISIILGITTVVLIALLWIIAANYRRRNRLYKNIVMQNSHAVARQTDMQQQIDKLIEQLEEAQQAAAGLHDSEKPDEEKPKRMSDERAEKLYHMACQLMEKQRLYADPKLNRELLAEMLGTNRTYLSQIIKEKSGMNYLQFVNSYRINEAIRILSDKKLTDYPIKQIWSDLGFNSPSTFYKLFQQTVGITPYVYRKQFLKVDEGLVDELTSRRVDE